MMTATANDRPSLIARSDTLLGVCEGLGEDLGIGANWFRIAFALALFFSPIGALVAYFGAGAVVLATRLLYPASRTGGDLVSARAEAIADEKAEELPLAA